MPIRTPTSWARVNDASTWSGSDRSGIRPATSLTRRGATFGVPTTVNWLLPIGREHAQVGMPIPKTETGVAEATSGRAVIPDIGLKPNRYAS